ncbi:hypothetical protein [Hoyosella altamirensis]|uniref:Uncharacterized protein n=1 Tax=Hoyosella altamirensis TaxID=616997 RepID=A0A839RTY5_9ACTN|nr:hypothetical protein [Hoyosella altamirensis]MBB3039819.1 hypothetical protein [Hoyosella altamirensis]
MTEETLELDTAGQDYLAVNRAETAPRAIPGHAAARFSAQKSQSVTFLIGGDPDRPVFIQVADGAQAVDDSCGIDVWAPPVYSVEVMGVGSGRVAVSLAPSHKRAAARFVA